MAKKKQTNIKKTDKKLEDCEKQKKEYLAGWQRERADFINYKKDELKKIEELVKYASLGMVLKLLPILDNFDIAEKKISEKSKSNKNIKGLLQIKNQLQDFLKNSGIETIEVLGKKFDPAYHEIVELVEEKGKESGIIIEEIQKGYTVRGKLLRPAKVKAVK
ncbi:MAG: nucleotide exchange factor GrpE [Patescibacteria group bacterium]|nr:nucleotide exchange factor GrpE [Patescibacteria group bacterium]